MNGGGGVDVFVLTATGVSRDVIAGFVAVNDTLEVSAAVFGGGLVAATPLLARQLVINATGLAGDGDDRFILNTTNGQLTFDTNGDLAGGATIIATFTGAIPPLTEADFAIV